MILQFSDTVTKKGIVQALERATGTQSSTSSSYPLYDKTVDINFALANFFMIGRRAEGRFQIDDTNQVDAPIVFFDIVSGQSDYSYTVDQNGNEIKEIYKIRVKDSLGVFHTLDQTDMQYESDTELDNSVLTNRPTKYDLSASGTITLIGTPNYNSIAGGEMYVNRGGSYFDSTDTTKKPGIPEEFGEYLVIRPAYFWCLTNDKARATGYYRTLYGIDGKSGMEKDIELYFTKRNKAEKPRMIPSCESNK